MANNNTDQNINDTTNTTTSTADTEPATTHDVGIGGGLGAVGGAIVGGLAGGPIGAVIGAVAGGLASAGAVDVVDKHDHDYVQTTQGTNTGTIAATDNATTTGYGTTGYDTTTTGTDYPDTAGRVGASVGTNFATTDYDTTNYDTTDKTRTGDTMQLREEELTASKQQVAAGEVTLHKEVITETKSIDVPVSREELVIERHPVSGGQAVAGDLDMDDEDEVLRIPLTEEQVTLEKTTFVTGEVSVGKRTVTETEHLSGTVRREEARIEAQDGAVVVERDGNTF